MSTFFWMACDLNFSMEGESLSSKDESDVTIVGLIFNFATFLNEFEKKQCLYSTFLLLFQKMTFELSAERWLPLGPPQCRASVTSASTAQESATVSAVHPDFLDLWQVNYLQWQHLLVLWYFIHHFEQFCTDIFTSRW